MSILTRKLSTIPTGGYRIAHPPMHAPAFDMPLDVRMDKFQDERYQAEIYRLQATFTVEAQIRDGDAAFAGPMLEEARRRLVDEVFGEYQRPLVHARRLIAAGQSADALHVLDQISQSMFATWGHEEPDYER